MLAKITAMLLHPMYSQFLGISLVKNLFRNINCVLQCFDTVGWVAERASGPYGGMVEVGTA